LPAAVAVSVAFGALLTYTSTSLLSDFQSQEVFGGTVSALAVVFVTWMIFWMRRAARGLPSKLDGGLSDHLCVRARGGKPIRTGRPHPGVRAAAGRRQRGVGAGRQRGPTRQSMVALAMLGAGVRQRAGFLWTEARALTVLGVLGGVATGGLVGAELIKVLTGIFDPPPEHPAVPWGFVTAVLIAVLGTAAIAAALSARWAARVEASRLRDF
jgi:iron permease FTR1 family protein